MNIMVFIAEQWILVSGLAALILLFFYRESTQGGPRLSVHELTNAVNNDNAIILDIRNNEEFRAGHIVDAINIPYTEVKERLETLNKYRDRQIVIVDKIGQHAGTVSRQLTSDGFNTTRLRGGISEWQQQNLPLVK